MTLTQTATGRRRRLLVPTTAESVPQPPPPERPAPQDPPIYRALVSHWADRGKTLPGRHDPEWARRVRDGGSEEQDGKAKGRRALTSTGPW
ncbi:hypothetical protein [Streptomyces sp. NPDC056949]|uniref:hypothetical protein n=1 Tax=Streptomyces sp. NPDC056949 TaxID=3345976 RepID=UPI003630FFE3